MTIRIRASFVAVPVCLAIVGCRGLALRQEPIGWRKTRTLCEFRTDDDLAKWQLRRSTPPSSFCIGEDATGVRVARLHYPAYAGKGEKWPAIIMKADAMPITDWSDFQYLRFYLTSPLGETLPLRLYLRNAGGSIGKCDIRLPAGTTGARLEIDLDAVLKERTDMAEIHFFMSTPPMDCSFTLRDLELATEDVGIVAHRQLGALAAHRALLDRTGDAGADARRTCQGLIVRIRNALSIVRGIPDENAGSNLLTAATKTRTWLNSDAQLEIVRLAPYLQVAEEAPGGASFGYGIESSMSKALWQDVPFTGELWGEAAVALAGDEEESVQIVVLSLRNVCGLRASLQWNPADCPLETELGWMGHVKTQRPPYDVDYVGWWPDPILTFLDNVDLPANRSEALWVTVRAPRGTPPGKYSGKVLLACADGTSYEVPLAAHVFAFDLPRKRHLPLALSWGEMLRQVYGLPETKKDAYTTAVRAGTAPDGVPDPEVERLLKIRRETADFLLRKRAEPDMIYRGTPPNLDEVERWISQGMTRFNVLHVSADKTRNVRILESIIPEIRKRGLMPCAYVYGFDEVKPEKFPQMKDVFGDIKTRWPDLQIMTTAYDHSFGLESGLADVVDIWVPLTPRYVANIGNVERARAQGRQIWWYTCCGPRHPYCNWFVEYPAIEARLLMGEQAFFSGAEGYLYYQLSRWVHEQYSKPISKPITGGPLTDWDPRSFRTYNGDGSVFCPGPDGPLSTVRLENIRDGLEDYEYLWMLRRALQLVGDGSSEVPSRRWLLEARTALLPYAPLKDMMTNVDRNPGLLIARRNKVAKLLEGWARANAQRTPPEPDAAP